jgi:hypothetical protein
MGREIKEGDFLIVNCIGYNATWIAKVKRTPGKMLVSEYEDGSKTILCDCLRIKERGIEEDFFMNDIGLSIYIPNSRFYNILTEKDHKLIDNFNSKSK